jgi:outer membrane receptor protein involved in Fe transport
MRRAVAIGAVSTALLTHVARAAEPKPFLPSGPPAPAPTDQGAPSEPPSEEPTPAPAPRDPDDVPITWSPTATWRPTGPSTYDEDLALAELLNMSATVATKNSAAVSRSPNSVTVYSEQDIRRLGYYTMADLADVTAGYSSYSIYGEKVFETRGQKAGSFVNNKHLILIDGIPVNHGRGNKAMIDENFPLFFANRVEFLKGPASALYGTGAFFGVVNVVPKELEDRGFHAEGRAGLGSDQSEKTVLANSMYRDGVRHAAIYAGYYEKGPSEEWTGTKDVVGNKLWDNQRSEFLYLTYGVDAGIFAGLKAGFIYSSKNGGLGEFWVGGYSPNYDDLTWVQTIPYLKYERRLGKSFTFDGYVKASRDIEQASVNAGSPTITSNTKDVALLYRFGVMSYEGLAEIRWEPSATLNVIGGLNVNVSYQYDGDGSFGGRIERNVGDVFAITPGVLGNDDLFRTYSPFLQLQQSLPILAGLHVTAGARLDAGQAIDTNFSQVSPRVGVVQELTDFLSLKVMYGEALRAPASKEIGLNREALFDLPDQPTPGLFSKVDARAQKLEPEIIRSLEGAISLNTTHVSANVAVFANDTRSALNETTVRGTAPSVNFFENAPGLIVARGTEIEVSAAATPDVRMFANYATAQASIEEQGAVRLSAVEFAKERAQLADVPIHKVNIGASYRFNKPIDLMASVVAKWVTGYRGTMLTPGNSPPANAPTSTNPIGAVTLPAPNTSLGAGEHLVVDANFIWRASEHTSLELIVTNVLNDVYKLPQGGAPYVPMPRRAVHATLDYRW